ncbi:hypothetical protein F0231_01345 [Vibrio sp. RE86]|uniref:hypothetical protein n=1 Tax=Vibrio sp. RE86 TaxID=2607605 RepID=UPI001493AED1|nr:hypothetical protein [Vibrio sp. RE86]NOH78380.1 hypothetical protein [Vibrio sp. RE86]
MDVDTYQFALQVFVMACSAYFVSKLILDHIHFPALTVITIVASLLTLIPVVGWVLALVAFVLIFHVTTKVAVEGCILVATSGMLLSYFALEGLNRFAAL